MTLAFDRRLDADGHLHARSRICKATVSPYQGNEIPEWQALGLDPDRVYWLLRDPEEVERAASTFNNKPILSEHVPISADAHPKELVIGCTGDSCAWEDPFLTNSTTFWPSENIRDIDSRRVEELSPAYQYRADMTPGNFRGLPYDGIMRDIIGNHLALVENGRQGPEVIVGDSAMKSRRALMLSGAFASHISPLLAQDKKLDLSAVLKDVTGKTIATDSGRKTLAAAVLRVAKPLLAKDAEMDVDDICKVIDTVQGTSLGEATDEIDTTVPAPPPGGQNPEGSMDGPNMAGRMLEFLKGKISDEDYQTLVEMTEGDVVGDEDETEEEKAARLKREAEEKGGAEDEDCPTVQNKPGAAMDANVLLKRMRRQFAATRQAERDVEKVTGPFAVALDSAAAIYRVGLKALKVDYTGVPDAGLGALFRASVNARDAAKPKAMAHDSAATAGARSELVKAVPGIDRFL